MNLMELLQLVDERLRPLAVADESALQAVLEEVAAGPRPARVEPDVEPRAVLAGRLVEIETECRMLRESLHVELTFVSRVEVNSRFEVDFQPPGPGHPRQAPADPSEPN